MPSFPFLRLPILVQLLILKHLSLLELFDFSTTSKLSKRIAKSVNLSLIKLDFLLDSTSNRHSICLEADDKNELEISIPISRSLPYQREELFGYQLSVARDRNPNWTFLAVESEDLKNLELLDLLTTHLLDLFECKQFLITMEGFSNQIISCFIWKHTENLKKLTFPGYFNAELSCADVQFIMEELMISDNLIIDQPVDKAFQYRGALKTKELEVKYADWLTLEAILNMDCESLDLRKTSLTFEDLNAIIRKWMKGEMESLDSLEIKVPATTASGTLDSQKLSEILQGIDTFKDKNGTFIRRNDGKKASVEVRGHKNRFDRFWFQVVS